MSRLDRGFVNGCDVYLGWTEGSVGPRVNRCGGCLGWTEGSVGPSECDGFAYN